CGGSFQKWVAAASRSAGLRRLHKRIDVGSKFMMETAREYKGYHRGMSGAWFDARGCLAAEGVSAIRDAPPGAAPEELAGHVAGCARCQQRLLTLESGPRP